MKDTEGTVDGKIPLGAMLRCFAFIGATGFGGVLPIVIHEIVTRRRWVTLQEFTEILAICQVLPGPNIVNFCVVFGMRRAGWAGAGTCLAGLLAAPLAIVMTLAALYTGFSEVPVVQDAVRALAAGAAGLICAMVAKLLWPQRSRPVTLLLVGLVILAMLVLQLPLIAVILLFGPVGIAYALWSHRRDG